jgi:hypothetical protein
VLHARRPADAPCATLAALPVDAQVSGALDGDRRVHCRACSSIVADARAKTEVNGVHVHTFINPAGIIFKVACYAAAPGTSPHGAPSTEWTWFPGHAWQAALCARCADHLGWSYRRPAHPAFVALILDKVIERGSDSNPSLPQ